MVKSNVSTVTIAAAPESLVLAPATDSLPNTGGTVDYSVQTNLSGATLYIFVNGSYLKSFTTDASGAGTFTVDFPANTQASAIQDQVFVSDNMSGT